MDMSLRVGALIRAELGMHGSPQPLASGSEGNRSHSSIPPPGETERSAQPSSTSVRARVKSEETGEVQPPRHVKKEHAGEAARTSLAPPPAVRVKPEPQEDEATFALLREPVTSPGESVKRVAQDAREDDDGTGGRGSGKRRRTERQSVLGLGREVIMLRLVCRDIFHAIHKSRTYTCCQV
jgi:hypothetical protein